MGKMWKTTRNVVVISIILGVYLNFLVHCYLHFFCIDIF
jgi:hypothetical protein